MAMCKGSIHASVKKSDLIQVDRMKRGKERPKITLVEIVKMNILVKEVTKNMILDRIEWWRKIHVVDLG